ncbi:MAG: hypothetical protein GY861_08725 [bacterium]|nr:hypothetical protein [bacterium]
MLPQIITDMLHKDETLVDRLQKNKTVKHGDFINELDRLHSENNASELLILRGMYMVWRNRGKDIDNPEFISMMDQELYENALHADLSRALKEFNSKEPEEREATADKGIGPMNPGPIGRFFMYATGYDPSKS